MSVWRSGVMTLHSSATPGNMVEVPLSPRPGGDNCSQLHYEMKVLAKSNAVLEVGLRVDDSPDGLATRTHSTPISAGTVGSPPLVLAGDADTATPLLPWVQPVVLVDIASGSTAAWVVVEVFEIRKAL